eukprot:m.40398 g.40398  ORF g.40398 m.40398 type:complete len:360 (+) comp9661_c0_seq2:274-1353(+)
MLCVRKPTVSNSMLSPERQDDVDLSFDTTLFSPISYEDNEDDLVDQNSQDNKNQLIYNSLKSKSNFSSSCSRSSVLRICRNEGSPPVSIINNKNADETPDSRAAYTRAVRSMSIGGRSPSPEHDLTTIGSPRSLSSGKRSRARARGRRSDVSKGGSPTPVETLIIMNLPFTLTKAELEAFLECDPQTAGAEVSLKEKQGGGFSGMAFVAYPDVSSAIAARECLIEKDMGGRKVRVEFKARSRANSITSPGNSPNMRPRAFSQPSGSVPAILGQPPRIKAVYFSERPRSESMRSHTNAFSASVGKPASFVGSGSKSFGKQHNRQQCFPIRQPIGPSGDGRGFRQHRSASLGARPLSSSAR